MGSSTSSLATEAPDELTMLFDPSELAALRQAYSKLCDQKSQTLLNLDGLAHLTERFPWAALFRDMRERVSPANAPVCFRDFLASVAAICKGRRSERIATVASLYAVGPQRLLSSSSLRNLLADAAVAARGGDASAPPSDDALAALAADVLLCGGGVATPAQWASWVGSHLPALPQAHETWLLQFLCALGRALPAAGASSSSSSSPNSALTQPSSSLHLQTAAGRRRGGVAATLALRRRLPPRTAGRPGGRGRL
jgi:hypothetical protein